MRYLNSYTSLLLAALTLGCGGEESTPQGSEALCKRGFDRESEGEMKQARADFEAALTLEPGYAGALYGLAEIALDAEKLEQALELYDRAIESDPKFAMAYLGRSFVHSELGDEEAARGDSEQATTPAAGPACPGSQQRGHQPHDVR